MSTQKDVMNGKWERVFFTELNLLDEKHARGRQGPCPICGGKDRFRFDDKDGRGTWYCNHCGAGDGYRLYMATQHITDFNEAVKLCGERYGGVIAKQVRPPVDHAPMLRRLWSGCLTTTAPLKDYLRSRGINRVPAGVFGPVLRYHPNCPWRDGSLSGEAPAMLARVFNGDGQPATIHRTFLTNDVPLRKMMLPHNGKLSGAYIPLGHPKRNQLGVAEGIETALSCSIMHGVVTWATYCADQLEKFVVNDNIDKLDVFADNDSSFVGQSAAYTLARRMKLKRGDLIVSVSVPPDPDTDFNDVLENQACTASTSLPSLTAPRD